MLDMPFYFYKFTPKLSKMRFYLRKLISKLPNFNIYEAREDIFSNTQKHFSIFAIKDLD